MSTWQIWLTGVATVFLLTYLVYALLRAEDVQ